MNDDRTMVRAIALTLSVFLAAPLPAQTSGNQTPRVQYDTGFRGTYRPASVSPANFGDSGRARDLIRAGQLYLSLDDAIAIALENNLDLQLQRFGSQLAVTDELRARGGSTLRGVNLTVNEAPAGVGGPGSPLNNSAASGVTPQTAIPLNVTDTQLIAESVTNLAVTGTFPTISGPALPFYDPFVNASTLVQHLSVLQTNLATNGTPVASTTNFNNNVAYTQGFSLGTNLTGAFQTQRTLQDAPRNLFNPYYLSNLGFTVTQPLMRGFGKEMNRRFIRIAKNSEKITDYVFQQQVVSTVSGVVRLYYDLVSLIEDLRVKEQTQATAQRLYTDNQSKVEQGTLAPIELTRAQAQVAAARQDSINAEGFVRQQELILKNFLMGNATTDPLVHSARIVPTSPLVMEDQPTQTIDELVKSAVANRPEYQAAQLQIDNANIGLEGARNGLLPQLDIVGTMTNAGYAGPQDSTLGIVPPGAYLGLGGGFGSSLGQIFRRDYPNLSIGLNLTLPIHNRTAQADLARDEIQLRQTQIRARQVENQIRVEVEDALIALQRTRAAYDAAVETRRLQEQSLEIENERFASGLSTNFLVIQYESFVAQARSSEVAARGAWAKARNQYERVLGVILDIHHVSIDEAARGQVSRPSVPDIPRH
jgi:outer membrane protein TolC